MRKNLMILLCLSIFINSCGIPDASSFETLLPPLLIDDKIDYPSCTYDPNGSVSITLKVMLYNRELSFSGYNVYYNSNFGSQNDLDTQMKTAIEAHILTISGQSTFNANTEKNSIIKNGNSLPTIPAGHSSIIGYDKEPSIHYITVTKSPFKENLQAASSHGFTITAVSMINVTESPWGNSLQVDSKKAISQPGVATYCGQD